MDCRQFRQNWQPGAPVPASPRQRTHLQRCDACRQWQVEQSAADQWLRASLRAGLEAPVAPALAARLRAALRQNPPPRSAVAENGVRRRPIAWQGLWDTIGYAAAAAVTAAALLAAALGQQL